MNDLAKVETGLTLQPKEITLNQVQIAETMGQLAYDSGIFKAPKPAAAVEKPAEEAVAVQLPTSLPK